jgi:helicase
MAMSSVFDREEIDDDIDIAWREHQVSLYERVRALQHMIHMGLDDSAVTLTLISGIGAKMAKQLQAAGIRDIEELALAEPEALQIVPRLSAHRATKWIQQAMALVKSHSAFAYRETGATAAITPPDWPSTIDPYRLRRALELHIRGADGGCYFVTGGLEPHIVRIKNSCFSCDCPDVNQKFVCKHVLAVRMHRGDRELRKLSRQLGTLSDDATFNLFNLWFDHNPLARKRRVR